MNPQNEIDQARGLEIDAAAERDKASRSTTRTRRVIERQEKETDPMGELCRRVHQGQMRHGTR